LAVLLHIQEVLVYNIGADAGLMVFVDFSVYPEKCPDSSIN
jgi:hypothetical protein